MEKGDVKRMWILSYALLFPLKLEEGVRVLIRDWEGGSIREERRYWERSMRENDSGVGFHDAISSATRHKDDMQARSGPQIKFY